MIGFIGKAGWRIIGNEYGLTSAKHVCKNNYPPVTGSYSFPDDVWSCPNCGDTIENWADKGNAVPITRTNL